MKRDRLVWLYEIRINNILLTHRKVDYEIVDILRRRFYNCLKYERNVNEYHRNFDLCPNEKKDWQDAEVNYFIKCIINCQLFIINYFYFNRRRSRALC